MSYLLKNFLRGLLLLVPMAAAIYVVVYLYNFLDNLIPPSSTGSDEEDLDASK